MSIAILEAVNTSYVPFNGQQVLTAMASGIAYVAMKPIVENLGMSWGTQQQKLSRHIGKFGCIHMNMPSAGGIQKMLVLPLKKLNGWLFSINPEKVRADIRDKLIQYQEECFTVLHDYWTKGQVVNPRKAVKTQPGKITADQQYAIKEMVMSRGQALPKDKQAKAIITMWSALKSHFGVSYKDIEAGQFNEAVSLVARIPLEGELISARDVLLAEEKLSAEVVAAIRGVVKNNTKQYEASLKPGYREHIHSPEGVLGLTEHSLLMNLLRQMEDDGHDVSGAAAELTTIFCYVAGVRRCISDITTNAQYILKQVNDF
ncbi:phage antirepressor N-terminal domain-containing protein [Enterobacter rongchengensis]|uniref:phage antirepressor N-terminal domain-containing protein n=1 Tax=Enterobacter rongchengensis TaxID=3030999 RepID=UPI003B26C6A7